MKTGWWLLIIFGVFVLTTLFWAGAYKNLLLLQASDTDNTTNNNINQ